MEPIEIQIANFMMHWPANRDLWKRFRVAMTREEVELYRQSQIAAGRSEFVLAVRGLPIQIEEHPTDPAYLIEQLP